MIRTIAIVLGFLTVAIAGAQEKSVRPDINVPFQNPDLKKYLGSFEGESREIFAHREDIVRAAKLRKDMVVADVGAGTGLFSRLFAKEAAKVFAVDIAPTFLDHIAKTCKEQQITNVALVRCSQTSSELPAGVVDLVFICDTYHHFEFPFRTMASIHRALKPGGQLILIDFERIPGKTKEWTLNHVRAGKEEFVAEICKSGFRKVEDVSLPLKENYCVRFERLATPHRIDATREFP